MLVTFIHYSVSLLQLSKQTEICQLNCVFIVERTPKEIIHADPNDVYGMQNLSVSPDTPPMKTKRRRRLPSVPPTPHYVSKISQCNIRKRKWKGLPKSPTSLEDMSHIFRLFFR